MPFNASAAPDERSGLRTYIEQQLAGIRHTSFGLTEDQIRLAPTRSTLTIGGLLKHVGNCTESWVARLEAAPGEPPRPDDDEAAQAYRDDFVVEDTDTLASILESFDAVVAHTAAVVDDLDLDVAVPVPDAPWFPKDVQSWTGRWVLLHLIEEIARHAGHADITRENIDGATMYELVAAAEGIGDTPFLRAWRPAGDPA
ncbi:DinB family protein [Tsukamurella sp. 8F]|uniref:DinB family protein n=1 Tax=unclassified Tsukamurella TaxID=2633480 RepID=UPI0023B9C509|nr:MULTISPECIES: DinB family protein [unclassified Tsukamurella]MDF0532367.1 DinB family protein [Tsukamurella sp. 8J]MDF0589375.1 DinB family protein [Tsukamurella sp. 8F]